MGEQKACCFIGHRNVPKTNELTEKLNSVICGLIKTGVTRFIFGTRSDFNDLCYELVSDLKMRFPHIVRVVYQTKTNYYLTEEQYADLYPKEYREKKGKSYYGWCEEVYYEEKWLRGGLASYVERNEKMIDDSDHCVFYYDKDYVPSKNKYSGLTLVGIYSGGKSGTKIAYEYALKRKKNIINVFNG